MGNKSVKKLILIDGNAIIHRSYHALPPLTTKKGELVNAVYGFATTLFNVINKFKPDYIIATFDLAGLTFRHEEFTDYKAHREKAPDELYAQIERVKELVSAFDIPIFEKQGYEADDVIGTVVRISEECKDPIENIIVTGDLDTLQLISPKTKVFTMRRGLTDSVLYDEEKVRERYNLRPDQLIDFKGLRGDASDNIPGVKGIGEKTAIDLLSKYETLEQVYRNISELKGAVKDKLERDKMMAIKSKRLATIVRDVPIELDFSSLVVHKVDREKLTKLFKELEFFSLIKKLPGVAGELEEQEQKKQNKEILDLIISESVDEFLASIKNNKEIAIKLEMVGEKVLERELKGVALCCEEGKAGFIEYNGENHPKIKKLLENKNIAKVGYDLKVGLEILKKHNIDLAGDLFDVMLAAYVLNPGAKIDFPTLVLAELGEEIITEKKKGQLGLDIEPRQEEVKKICQQAEYIYKLKKIYEKQIKEISATQNKERNLINIFDNIERPLIEILAEMEMRGVRLNVDIFYGISEKINKKIINLEKKIQELAGEEFNVNSSRQLADILFNKFKIPALDIKKGKTGYSTASLELQKIRDKHEIIGKIEDYRELFKLKTTYLDTLPLLVDKNFRIHSSFNQAVTATGRLSSSDPNLQNIPIRTEVGQLLRNAFEAEDGYRLVAADYSQIDLRVMAHVSQDKTLLELFHRGEDIHRATASLINGVSLSAVTDKMRRGAKELNFGVIYGISPFGFAMRSGVDRDQAKKFIDEYFEKFPAVAKYMKETKEKVRENGYVETETGRRRYIPEINSANFQIQSAAERMAINMPIQGLSADIVKLAMIKVYEEYKNNQDVRIILQVHDEIILEVKENIAEEVGKKIKEIMERAYVLKVPLVVDVKVGDNWGEV